MDRNTSLPLRSTLNPLRILHSLWLEREIVMQLTRHDVAATYRGSVLGLVWMVIQPLLSLGVYTFVFTQVFTPRASVDESGPIEFVLSLFAGMVVYNLFAEVLSRSATLVESKTSYVKNVVFPLEVLPVTALGTSFVSFAFGMLILMIAILSTRGELSLAVLWLPVSVLPLVLLTLGLSWFLSSLGVFLRDVQPTVTVLLQLLFFATPIVYGIEKLSPELQRLLMLNPLAPIVINVRAGLLHGSAPDWPSYAASMVVALVTLCAGYTWFARTRKGFADVM